MSGRTRTGPWIAAGVMLAMLVPEAMAAPEPRPALATPTPAGAGLLWLARPDAGAMVLRVAGGGTVSARAFRRGETPMFALDRGDGSALPDGAYSWELEEQLAPVNDGVFDPANGRDSASHDRGRRPVAVKGRVQSGVFTVKGGMVVSSSLSEAAVPRGGAR